MERLKNETPRFIYSYALYHIELIKQYETYYQESQQYTGWISKQDDFSKAAFNLRNQPYCKDWGYHTYRIETPIITENKGPCLLTVSHHFSYSFCKDQSLDYTLKPNYKTNYECLADFISLKLTLPNSFYDNIMSFLESLPKPLSVVFADSEQGENKDIFNCFQFERLMDQLEEKGIDDWDIDDPKLYEQKDIQNIVIIEFITSYTALHRNCQMMFEKFKDQQVCITYLSVLKEITSTEFKDLVELSKKELEEKKLREIRAKKEQEKQRLYDLSHNQKTNASQIRTYLRNNHVQCFYHFTDRDNLESIIKNGGLYSWKYCEDNDIYIPTPGGDGLSRKRDIMFGLEDYVRLSFCDDHPMAWRLEQDGADLVLLKIKVDVACIEGTIFSDMNAIDGLHYRGETLQDLEMIDIPATKEHYVSRNSSIFKQHQAEVLVKTFIPLEYIVNINNPISL